MKISVPLFLSSLGVLAYGMYGFPSRSGEQKSAGISKVDFDRDVMPILSQRCFKCHGPDASKAAAGLRLDSLAAARKDDVIVPGSPEKSRLLKRVSEANPDDRMPPPDSGVKSLSPDQIRILKEWIRSGAKYEKHWSFVPPKRSPLPSVKDQNWGENRVDHFVLAKLEQSNLRPEPEADRSTLALRAAQTLTGLPPTVGDLTAYLADRQPGAYERFVDRLLASPAYGEHQARYWLDAVRYADTHGLQLDNERGVYPYRDWVVRAYHQDLPFNKFIEWQLAGDRLPNPTTDQLIATGYVRMNLTTNEGGAIEEEFLARNTFDRVDTTSTVLLGLTAQCARCHDHKYDPIKQKDYYGLYAFFNSTTDQPLDGNITFPPPSIRAPSPEQAAESHSLRARQTRLIRSMDGAAALREFDAQPTELPISSGWEISPVYGSPTFDEAFDAVNSPEMRSAEVKWKPFPLEIGKDYAGIIGRDNAAVYLRGRVTFSRAQSYTFGVSSDDGVKVWLNGKLIHSHKVGRGVGDAIDSVTGDFRAGENELLLKIVNGIEPDGVNLRLADAGKMRLTASAEAYRKKPSSPTAKDDFLRSLLEVGPMSPEAKEYRAVGKQITDLESSIPMTLIAQEMPSPRPTFILKRGLYDQKGEAVTRHIPPALGALAPGVRPDRLSLARWITSPANPLLARVYVNRLWQQFFGTGIVKTSEDFGSQGEWPVNQPLLDDLAMELIQSGWSTKHLARLIVTSAAFRQSSVVSAKKLSADPENRLISRGPRFRLDAEVIRDKALFAGGLLVRDLGGRGFKPYQPDGIWEAASDPASSTHIYTRDRDKSIYRRSLYLFWKRTAPPPTMLTFDAPLRDTCTVRRSTTNTPLQALATENDPAFLEASRTMAERLLQAETDDQSRLRRAFRQAMARAPHPDEIVILSRALGQYRSVYSRDLAAARRLIAVGDAPVDTKLSASETAAWMLVCSTLMNTNEFLTLH